MAKYTIKLATMPGLNADYDPSTDRTCKIVRFYARGPATKVVKRGLTHDQAMRHCIDPETCSKTATKDRATAHTRQHGQWFDGWDWE